MGFFIRTWRHLVHFTPFRATCSSYWLEEFSWRNVRKCTYSRVYSTVLITRGTSCWYLFFPRNSSHPICIPRVLEWAPCTYPELTNTISTSHSRKALHALPGTFWHMDINLSLAFPWELLVTKILFLISHPVPQHAVLYFQFFTWCFSPPEPGKGQNSKSSSISQMF